MVAKEILFKVGRGLGKGLLVFLQIFGTLVLVGLITMLIFGCIFAKYVKDDLSQQVDFTVEGFSLDQTSIIYYTDPTTGNYVELQQLYGEENRVWASIDTIPTNLIYACVAIEDKRYFEHQGVDWLTTAQAGVNMFLGSRSTFGGSTITQQLIKNLTDEDEVTVRRKLIEIFRALEFEKNYSKDHILEWYLNTIYLGEGCYGVQSAARVYFGKDVSELTLAECASLISITNNPSIYDPYISEENNRSRQVTVLGAMLEQEIITNAEYSAAMAQEMVFINNSSDEDDVDSSNYYSYFVDEVIRDVVADLQELTGFSESVVYQMVCSGGYKIYTTLNPDVQAAVDEVYQDLSQIPDTKSLQQMQSAIVILDNDTGDIVAIAGGVGEKSGSLNFNRATQAYLSPGSTIKPVSVYAPALEAGLITPATVYDDTPYTFTESGYWPNNQDLDFDGLISINAAMADSTNTVPVKVLADLGLEEAFQFAQEEMGLTTLVDQLVKGEAVYSDIDFAPLALGNLTNGVTVESMAQAYGAFANDGVYRESRTYTMVTNINGDVILDNTQDKHQALSEKSNWYMTYMLQNVVTSGTGTDAQIDNMAVAGKTGTTSSDKDRWFCGYTPYYTAAVWCGYDQQEEIILSDSTMSPAIALWQSVMATVHEDLAPATFEQPSELVTAYYCQDSGLLATTACTCDPRGSREVAGLFFPEDVPVSSCDVHSLYDVCGETGNIANEYCYDDSDNTITQIGLLNITRTFPMENILISDQLYAFTDTYSVPSGYYPAISSTTNAYNFICTTHEAPVYVPVVPVVPDVVEEPLLDIPSTSDDLWEQVEDLDTEEPSTDTELPDDAVIIVSGGETIVIQ